MLRFQVQFRKSRSWIWSIANQIPLLSTNFTKTKKPKKTANSLCQLKENRKDKALDWEIWLKINNWLWAHPEEALGQITLQRGRRMIQLTISSTKQTMSITFTIIITLFRRQYHFLNSNNNSLNLKIKNRLSQTTTI